jgi:hypothetical protein
MLEDVYRNVRGKQESDLISKLQNTPLQNSLLLIMGKVITVRDIRNNKGQVKLSL